MKAVLCRAVGAPDDLVVEDVAPPEIKPGHVRLRVLAVGVNFPDLLLIEGKYQHRPPFPFSPGIECAGEVIELGPDVTGLTIGQRVMAMLGHGGMAEEVVARADMCCPVPDAMGDAEAAGFMVTYGTSYHALVQRAALQPGEVLLVHGASGGVGLTAVEIGKRLGATVIATGGDDKKLESARDYGADHLINYRHEPIRERVKELTGGRGADVIYDPVGGDVFDASMRCINWNGRILVIGFASGRIAEAATNIILLKGCSVVGVAWGAFAKRDPATNGANIKSLLGWYAKGELRPLISTTMRIDQATEALNALAARRVVGKMVLSGWAE